jgi:hypothetical protein
MITLVKFVLPSQYNDWEVNDTGHIDGYVQGSNGRPYAVVILDKSRKFVLASISDIEYNN